MSVIQFPNKEQIELRQLIAALKDFQAKIDHVTGTPAESLKNSVEFHLDYYQAILKIKDE